MPPRRVGRYVLAPPFASGGTATVHLGRLLGDAGFSRAVAVKRLRPQLIDDPAFAAMLVDEARLVSRVRHPNVVPVLDVVRDEGELLLVLDYVQGESLGRLLHLSVLAGQRPGASVVMAVMAGVLHGLHAAHEAMDEAGAPLGLVHRDVSPQNILVGTDGVARVCDFGIAKALGRAQHTRDGQLKGKLAYMAPEQLCDGEVDRRVDVYAASVVLWEALTARRLFAAESEGAIVNQVLRGAVTAPSAHAPGVSPALDAIVRRGLSTDPAGRFATARAMALALEEACEAGRAAPASSVGAWVERTARPGLAERAAQLAALEALTEGAGPAGAPVGEWPGAAEALEPTASDVDVAAGRASTPRGADGRGAGGPGRASGHWARLAVVGAALAASLGAIGLGVVARGRSEAPRGAGALAAPLLSSPPPPEGGTVGAGSYAPVEPAAPAALPPTEGAAGRQVGAPPVGPKAGAKPRVGGRPRPRSGDCDPPYVQGPDGQKHFRRECFGR